MAEPPRNLSTLLAMPVLLAVIGCAIAEAIFGSKLFTWISTFTIQWICVGSLGVFIGLIGFLQELQNAKHMQYDADPKESRELRQGWMWGMGVVIGMCLLFYLLQYLATGLSEKILIEAAYYFILAGAMFGIIFGLTFLGTILGRMGKR